MESNEVQVYVRVRAQEGRKALHVDAEAGELVLKAAGEEILFFYAKAAGGPTGQIRKLAQMGAPGAYAQMALLDIPDNGGYYSSEATEVTVDTVTAFLDAFKAKALERQQMSQG